MKNWFSKKASSDDVFVISKPTNCAESPDPILDPTCKVAIVIGGANGFGFAAADYLLCGGARRIVIADFDRIEGDAAVQKLCNRHGRARACFVPCDIRNAHQFEVALNQACSQYEKVHILFNDLDKQRFASHRQGDTSSPTGGKSVWQNNTMRGIHYGMKVMGKQNGGPGGIIINCASVLGFMGWPQDPSPVYCMKEPSIETTLDLSKEYPLKDTGVRLVALCPTNKPFSEIGLPDFPNSTSCTLPHERLPCIPLSKWRIGNALSHILAWAETGSAWIMEPTSAYEIPRQIHFPAKNGDIIDSNIYNTQTCPVEQKPRCAKISNSSCGLSKYKKCDPKTKQ